MSTKYISTKRDKIILICAIISFLLGMFLIYFYVKNSSKKEIQPPIETIQIGEKISPIKIKTQLGKIDTNYISKPIVLEIFATWCPHCQKMTKILNDLREYHSDIVFIFAVSGSPYSGDGKTPQSLKDIKNFTKRFHVHYPIGYDPSLKISKRYLSTGFPTFVLIGRDKKIKVLYAGEIQYKELLKKVNNL